MPSSCTMSSKFVVGDLVQPAPECKEDVKFRVLGSPVFKDQWWVPIHDPREDDPTFFKAALLVKSEPLKDGDICPVCQEMFRESGDHIMPAGCECEGTD